ncbi:uncharacterized protein LTR77_002862 [Saxophila tyrrhenica]|uniref:Uncharacterized protein n=1 Tax=Saxophila tyrrhenica TaxID=1690608 RepID=A0AAV9PIX7_9PEZI|nr:hypothetical protein LTR77_002862 [Saxophila tyrrhenica]
MPTQRSFFSNFLLAFRAHSHQQIPKPQPSRSSNGVSTQSQTLWTSAQPQQPSKTPSSENVTSPRPINPKAPHQYSTSHQQQPNLSTSPGSADLRPALQHNVSPSTHLPRSSPSPGLPVYGPPNKPQPSYPTAAESRSRRRGSDSSSDSGAFRDRGEKWFVGGRTAAGEEKYYKLSMVKRERSADRISADQLSL